MKITGGDIILAAGVLGGLYLLYRAEQGLETKLANTNFTPQANVSLPNISLPNISLPNITVDTGLGDLANLFGGFFGGGNQSTAPSGGNTHTQSANDVSYSAATTALSTATGLTTAQLMSGSSLNPYYHAAEDTLNFAVSNSPMSILSGAIQNAILPDTSKSLPSTTSANTSNVSTSTSAPLSSLVSASVQKSAGSVIGSALTGISSGSSTLSSTTRTSDSGNAIAARTGYHGVILGEVGAAKYGVPVGTYVG